MNKLALVKRIMADFSERTCLKKEGCIPVRYLWTDAFAVCNFLGLFLETGEIDYKKDALLLVDQVHHILGKHRRDDPRDGWISGLNDEEGEKHPTIGGLRIGKKSNARKKEDPIDEKLEWEQDGQYFHYLTKWMHALNLVTIVTGDLKYNLWAIELAKTAYDKFTYTVYGNTKRMYWKMCIDLSYPLVTSMGQHDALDGYITYLEVIKTAFEENTFHLDNQMESLFHIAQTMKLESSDPLAIGGLLNNASLLTQHIVEYKMIHLSDMLLMLLHASLKGVDAFADSNTLEYPAGYRLAFRELGFSIGLHGVKKMQTVIKKHPEDFTNHPLLEVKLDDLAAHFPLCDSIENFWINPQNQKSNSWCEHLDINSVMLATALHSESFLCIG